MVGKCFQHESPLVEELTSLSACVRITIRKDPQLQVPFPPLNKVLPSPSAQGLAECAVQELTVTEHPRTSLKSGNPHEPRTDSLEILPETIDWKHSAERFLEILAGAVKVRVSNAPRLPSCQAHKSEPEACSQLRVLPDSTLQPGSAPSTDMVFGKAKIGVLFSGGVDSVVLAALVDRLDAYMYVCMYV